MSGDAPRDFQRIAPERPGTPETPARPATPGSAGADATLAALRHGVRSLPGCLHEALGVPVPKLALVPRTVITTGIGSSEGPARVLATALVRAGMAARFCETWRFAIDPPSADLLVVFSQGLSPNARLALGDLEGFGARWLVTSRNHADSVGDSPIGRACARGIVPIVIPPENEDGMLVRVVGPTVATLMALRIAASLLDWEDLHDRLAGAPAAYRSVLHTSGPSAISRIRLDGPLAIVTAGLPLDWAYSHRWKLLEGLLDSDPSLWDVLQVAHGPLQSFHTRPMTLLVLELAAASPLVERLRETIVPSLHHVVRIRSRHDDELAFFEHAATIDALLLATLEAAPRDLFQWPGQGLDGPLYGYGAD